MAYMAGIVTMTIGTVIADYIGIVLKLITNVAKDYLPKLFGLSHYVLTARSTDSDVMAIIKFLESKKDNGSRGINGNISGWVHGWWYIGRLSRMQSERSGSITYHVNIIVSPKIFKYKPITKCVKPGIRFMKVRGMSNNRQFLRGTMRPLLPRPIQETALTIITTVRNTTAMLHNGDMDPLLVLTSGGTGTGKSVLAQLITGLLKYSYLITGFDPSVPGGSFDALHVAVTSKLGCGKDTPIVYAIEEWDSVVDKILGLIDRGAGNPFAIQLVSKSDVNTFIDSIHDSYQGEGIILMFTYNPKPPGNIKHESFEDDDSFRRPGRFNIMFNFDNNTAAVYNGTTAVYTTSLDPENFEGEEAIKEFILNGEL